MGSSEENTLELDLRRRRLRYRLLYRGTREASILLKDVLERLDALSEKQMKFLEKLEYSEEYELYPILQKLKDTLKE